MSNFIKSVYKQLCKPKIKPDLNEPIYYQLKSPYKNKLLKLVYCLSPTKEYERVINERIVEIPFVFQNLDLKKGSNIVEVGCNTSKLSIELASLGYNVTGFDLNDYSLSHPNFQFIKENFLNNTFKDETFDAAISISVIEHCGLGAYNESEFSNGDHQVVDEIYRVLKKDGKFIITVPFGIKDVDYKQRSYDEKSLGGLLKKFKIENEEFYMGLGRKEWIPVKKEELKNVDSTKEGYTQGVACVLCRK